jgi:hypothetical protein
MIWRAVSFLMLLLFLLAVAVQYNDPDPAQWAAIYGAAAIASLTAVLNKPLPRYVTGALALAALAWAGYIVFTQRAADTSFGAMFGTWKMTDSAAEEGREAIGLGIVGAWALALTAAPRERR